MDPFIKSENVTSRWSTLEEQCAFGPSGYHLGRKKNFLPASCLNMLRVLFERKEACSKKYNYKIKKG